MADERDFEYYINTNGSLIDKYMAKKLGATKIPLLCISIDGPNAEIHDRCRGYKGSFDKVVETVKLVSDQGIRIQGIITLSNLNGDYLFETLELLKNIGISNASMMLLATVGYANTNLKNVALDYNKWASILIKLSEMKINDTLPVNIRIAPTGESIHPWELYLPLKEHNKLDYLDLWLSRKTRETVNQEEFGCTAGRDYFAIDGYGDVYGCGLMVSERKLKAGNILESSLKDIWYNSEVFNSFRNMKLREVKGKCKDCDILDLCKAGCRVSAFSLTGELTGSDIRCPSTKGE